MIALKDTKDIDLFQLAKLLADGGWSGAALDVGRLSEMVRAAARVVWAGDDTQLFAFGSTLTDGVVFGVVTHLVVRQDHRLRGLGRAVVIRLTDGYPGLRFAMHAPSSAAEFCARIGFSLGRDALYYSAESPAA